MRVGANVFIEALAVVASLIMLASCSSTRTAPYPTRWPPLAAPTTPDCAAVAGRYRERGENADPSLALFTLTLFGSESMWPDATDVLLRVAADAVHATVFADQNTLSTKSFAAAAGEYTCDNGIAVLRIRIKVVGEGISGDETATLRLFAQADYLVVRVVAFGDGREMFVPAKWSTDSWSRFQRVDQTK